MPSDDRIKVLLPLPLGGALDYAVAGARPAPGSFVRVPLPGRETTAVVWDDASPFSRGGRAVPDDKLKPVLEVLDAPPLPDDVRRFVDWVAQYTLSAPGAVLRMAMSAPAALGPPPTRTHYVRTGDAPQRLTDARRRVLDVTADGLPRTAADLAKAAGVTSGVVRGLVEAGTLTGVALPVDRPYPELTRCEDGAPALSAEQQAVAARLRGQVHARAFRPTLLEGVTGAGKTEVYFEAIAAALAEPDAQVLVLLPEIALTTQWLDRFTARFGTAPVAWHSDIGPTERRRAWRAVAEGRARIVVGARSALFLPFQALRLIVLDEEHDPSFKQEDGVLYNARDMAVVRATLAPCAVVLVSATPSLETLVNAQRGRYDHERLTARYGGASLPTVEPVDLRATPPEPGRWLSPPLVAALTDTLDKQEQAILFLNRRGYAPLTLCRACGARIECPQCSAWLVEHRYAGNLQCHHCGYRTARPDACPACGAEDSLVPCGPGVERLEEELAGRFPTARTVVMTSDTVHGPADAAAIVRDIEAGLVDILVGTQIVTKGYHFPKLTLVGVVDADLGLRGGDLRAAERTYQQLAQVAGRAGRAERPGRVLLQTYMPEHPVATALAAGDQQGFLDREIASRRQAGLPPFGRLVALVVSGPDLDRVADTARRLARTAPTGDDVAVFGPAPAPLARLRGHYRHRLLLKAGPDTRVQALTHRWLAQAGPFKGVRVRVDVDPYSFL